MSRLIDGRTGEVIPETQFPNSPWPAGGGFGQTRKLFEVSPPRLHPWLTPELIEEELAIQRYEGVHGG